MGSRVKKKKLKQYEFNLQATQPFRICFNDMVQTWIGFPNVMCFAKITRQARSGKNGSVSEVFLQKDYEYVSDVHCTTLALNHDG